MTDTTVSSWTGWAVFAAIILFIGGMLDLIFGLIAIIGPNSAYFLTTTGTLFLVDIAGWGWWHVITGAAMLVVAFALVRGATWARVVAIILAAINAIGQLATLPAQPWWSLIMLAIDILVIYAVTVHGRDLKESQRS